MDYNEFLLRKTQAPECGGIEPVHIPEMLFPFQQALAEWSLRQGRGAVFADCGLGKTAVFLTWAENVARVTNKRVLILAPLAVSQQIVGEGEKFGVEVGRSTDGKPCGHITTTNYERLEKFNEDDFDAVVCDESSIIKHWSGKTQKMVTRFLSKKPYRLLCTATPAPNDFVELGTSSEALGVLTHSEMLEVFFRQVSDDEKRRKATQFDIINSNKLSWRVLQSIGQWAMKAHAWEPFWRFVSSWARACRKPSDLGDFDDSPFVLPQLDRHDHVVTPSKPPPGMLFTIPAFGLSQERSERRRTIPERVDLVANLVNHSDPAVVWCSLNDESDALEHGIPDAVQVKGSQSIDEKEELLTAFLTGQARVLVTKAKIAGLGLNMQHCAHVVTFVDHSYERFYQCVRRCYRFGQKRTVRLDVIATEGELNVARNMTRKGKQAEQMFQAVIDNMNQAKRVYAGCDGEAELVPQWIKGAK